MNECFQWTMLWLSERAIAARSGRSGAAEAIEQMMRFALRLDVFFFDLRTFREAIAYHREATDLSAMGLSDQVNECARAMASCSGKARAAFLFDLEQRLEQLYLALRLELTPSDAEAINITLSELSTLVRDVFILAKREPSDVSILKLENLRETLEAADEFYKRSQARGRVMAEKTLALMRSRGEDRAILVAGGFHERAITRAFEDHREVSWSVVTPQPKL